MKCMEWKQMDLSRVMANGIGIAGQLPYIKELLSSYYECNAKARRVALFWELDAEGMSYFTRPAALLTMQSTSMVGTRLDGRVAHSRRRSCKFLPLPGCQSLTVVDSRLEALHTRPVLI
jgi:hypothetical protein